MSIIDETIKQAGGEILPDNTWSPWAYFISHRCTDGAFILVQELDENEVRSFAWTGTDADGNPTIQQEATFTYDPTDNDSMIRVTILAIDHAKSLLA